MTAEQQGSDESGEGLTALLTTHRPNVVTEPRHDPVTGDQFVTRVKCDGETCHFYREGPRYWAVMDEHTAHLAEMVALSAGAALANPSAAQGEGEVPR